MESDIKILERFIRNHTEEAVLLIESSETNEIIDLLGRFPDDLAALTLSTMDRFNASRIMMEANHELTIRILEKCTPEAAANVLRPLDKKISGKILSGMAQDFATSIRLLLSYPENTVGSCLTPDVLTFSPKITIGAALEKIRNNPGGVQAYVYILSHDKTLKGFVDLPSLIAGQENKSLQSIMKTDYDSVLGSLQIDALINEYFNETNISSLPVVDINNVFLGIVERDKVRRRTKVKNSDRRQLHQTSAALGDLFQIGLSSLLKGTADVLWNSKDK